MMRAIFRAGPPWLTGSGRRLRRATFVLALACGAVMQAPSLVQAEPAASAMPPETIEATSAPSGSEASSVATPPVGAVEPSSPAATVASAATPAQIPAGDADVPVRTMMRRDHRVDREHAEYRKDQVPGR